MLLLNTNPQSNKNISKLVLMTNKSDTLHCNSMTYCAGVHIMFPRPEITPKLSNAYLFCYTIIRVNFEQSIAAATTAQYKIILICNISTIHCVQKKNTRSHFLSYL